MENFFYIQNELAYLQDQKNKIFANDSEYRNYMSKFIMSGLVILGYDKALAAFQEESGNSSLQIFDQTFENLIHNRKFEDALVHVRAIGFQKGLALEKQRFLEFEISKLQFYHFLLSNDTMAALKFFRQNLKNLEPYFSKEKKRLSQLYLIKGSENIVKSIRFNMNIASELTHYLRRVEYLMVTDHELSDNFEDPFEIMCRNNLAYQLMVCKYHNQNYEFEKCNGHSLNKSDNTSKGESLQKTGLENLLSGIYHKCPPPEVKNILFQKIEESNDEVWKIKFNKPGNLLLSSTRNRVLVCWVFENEKFTPFWKNQMELKEDINDFCINEKNSRVLLATQNKSVIIINLSSGARLATVSNAHADIITSIYSFANGDTYLTGGVDGFIIHWDINSQKVKELKTKRVISFSVSPCEAFLALVHSSSLFIDFVDLTNYIIKNDVIREKHQIISHQIDQNSQYILINTSYEIPELHLWRVSDGTLLNYFIGHMQKHFVIGCSFFMNNLICCGSEDGQLLYWHINDKNPILKEKRHDLCLNSIAMVLNQHTNRYFLATGADDGKIMITYLKTN